MYPAHHHHIHIPFTPIRPSSRPLPVPAELVRAAPMPPAVDWTRAHPLDGARACPFCPACGCCPPCPAHAPACSCPADPKPSCGWTWWPWTWWTWTWTSAYSQLDRLRRTTPVFLGLTVLFGIIEGCTTAFLVGRNNKSNSWENNSFRDRTRFLLFTSWWSVVLGAGYLLLFFVAAGSVVSSVLSHLVYVGITWLFWLSGAASFTHMLGGRGCGDNDHLLFCGQNEAAEAFAWIQFILFSLFFIVVGIMAGMTARRGDRITTPVGIA